MGRKNNYFVCFLLLAQLTSCVKNEESNSEVLNRSSLKVVSKSDFFSNEITWENLLGVNEKEYYAYIYSKTCSYCNKVKPKIIDFCSVIKVPMYFIIFSNSIPIKNNPRENIGKKDIDEVFIIGTPTLFKIKDSFISNCYSGYTEISEYIDSYKYENI